MSSLTNNNLIYMKHLTSPLLKSIQMFLLLVALIHFNLLTVRADNTIATNPPAGQAKAEEILSNSSILDLQKFGFNDDTILEKIKTSKCNFETSITALKDLKAANVSDRIIQAMMSGVPARTTTESVPVAQGDSNDPKASREPGVWLAQNVNGNVKMIQIMPTSSSQSHTGGGPFGGAMRDYFEGIHAVTQISERKPEFYFYFGAQGSTPLLGATTPTELVLARLTIKQTKTHNERVLVVGSVAPFSGVSYGVETKAQVVFDTAKISPGVYKVSPKEDLADGEYGFLNARGGGLMGGPASSIFDFGISTK